ncbi:SF1B family DNA helicase RecD2 [Anaeromicropila populeti]|uniref:ATP-dependent RecD2 DNA helicase n=1 Tax=Anaeromicropila populeti TaxID=37658 RepID=A0A1I6J327_9FIRM|nr:ATP-dependent RecD-like DNA helicase [Anaeromicropila populeti]SFR73271.1 exodeoxyribonuclease V alpha subunit [Anaeromicropila populeti]
MNGNEEITLAEKISGYVERIVYQNKDNGYTVLNISGEEGEMTCVGTFSFINEGDFIEVEGELTSHSVYGEQLKVLNYEIKEPEDMLSIERYLGSGAIKGLGPGLSARIVRRFKKDTFRIIEEEPERLSEIKGISERMAREISLQFEEKKEMRSAMIFLQQYGITMNLAIKIYQTYGNRLYEVIKENPYQLAEDINGVGFKQADEIAEKIGINTDSDYRVKAGIHHVLLYASTNGHVYLPKRELFAQTQELLQVDKEKIENQIMDLVIDKKIVAKETEEDVMIYASAFYYMELNCARMLLDLNVPYSVYEDDLEERLKNLEKITKLELDKMQRKAVMEAARNGVLIVTGGPGTGKTTTINTIIRFFESEGMEILLAAPTGRAAKRMSETTGFEAQTIHRLLEISGSSVESEKGNHFERNETNPLETDVLIIDEMSMVDISLMNSLLKATAVGTRLILVGDENQLPSVGPGNVLRDIIYSNCFPMVRLTTIFRQAAESDIIINAHKINEGKSIALDNKSKDFFLLQRETAPVIINVMLQLIMQKLPGYVNAAPYDIQVLTPMRKGELGVEKLNQVLQQYLNPPSPDKNEKVIGEGFFRVGDKVMQIKNNYQIEWEIKNKHGFTIDQGTGVFNGDMGTIKEINTFAETLTVIFEEGKAIQYGFSALDELELAYAVTIHKSQGSEYPAVVMPLLTGPRMLFNRNLLYTAVTRAKKCVTIVGKRETIEKMIENISETKRYSSLDLRLAEIQMQE